MKGYVMIYKMLVLGILSAHIQASELQTLMPDLASAKSPNLRLTMTKNYTSTVALSSNFMRSLKNLFKATTFVESGTFLGWTTQNAASVFPHVYTIELSQDIYQKAYTALQKFPQVTSYLGDSAVVLPTILSRIQGKALFWLDAHYSGNHFNHQTALGKKNVPILDELEAVRKAGYTQGIILIDDVRIFDPTIKIAPFVKAGRDAKEISGYPSLETVCKKIYQINPNYKVLIIGDILLAYPHDKSIIPSQVIKACTISRLYNGHNFPMPLVLKAEKIIGQVQGPEKVFLKKLYGIACTSPIIKACGIGKHYALWRALIAMHEGDYAYAYRLLNDLKNVWDHWRIRWYLAQAAAKTGRKDQAIQLLKLVIQKTQHIQGTILRSEGEHD